MNVIIMLFSDGQSVARRLSNQVTKATLAIRKGVHLYNDTISPTSPITFEQSVDLCSPLYSSILTGTQVIAYFNLWIVYITPSTAALAQLVKSLRDSVG